MALLRRAALHCCWLLLATPATALASPADLVRLLTSRQCPRCDLRGADLVHADLRGANLQGAVLVGANLGRANLQASNLQGADLRQASLLGANLSGTQLQGARLDGADLRQADLQGAQVNPVSLQRAHLQGAQHLPAGSKSPAALHNEAVQAYEQGDFPRAEALFSESIHAQPEQPESWIGRALTRSRQHQNETAAADLMHASKLTAQRGNQVGEKQLRDAAQHLQQQYQAQGNSNNRGAAITATTSGLLKILASLALKALTYGAL